MIIFTHLKQFAGSIVCLDKNDILLAMMFSWRYLFTTNRYYCALKLMSNCVFPIRTLVNGFIWHTISNLSTDWLTLHQPRIDMKKRELEKNWTINSMISIHTISFCCFSLLKIDSSLFHWTIYRTNEKNHPHNDIFLYLFLCLLLAHSTCCCFDDFMLLLLFLFLNLLV